MCYIQRKETKLGFDSSAEITPGKCFCPCSKKQLNKTYRVC